MVTTDSVKSWQRPKQQLTEIAARSRLCHVLLGLRSQESEMPISCDLDFLRSSQCNCLMVPRRRQEMQIGTIFSRRKNMDCMDLHGSAWRILHFPFEPLLRSVFVGEVTAPTHSNSRYLMFYVDRQEILSRSSCCLRLWPMTSRTVISDCTCEFLPRRCE